MSQVLVTGGSGYVGTQLIAALLRDGRRVRTTVRSLEQESDLRAAVRRVEADVAFLLGGAVALEAVRSEDGTNLRLEEIVAGGVSAGDGQHDLYGTDATEHDTASRTPDRDS